jgi:anti-sigma28 factor (negative regulator of flagellin synthesis)
MVTPMKVNEISKLNFITNVKKANNVKSVEKEKDADKVELSKEAKALSKSSSNLTPERIEEITKRIEEKFYDKDEVLSVVADRIMQSPTFRGIFQGGNLDKNI